MKRAALSSILIAVVLFAVAVVAEAQQPKKVPPNRVSFPARYRMGAAIGAGVGVTSGFIYDMRLNPVPTIKFQKSGKNFGLKGR